MALATMLLACSLVGCSNDLCPPEYQSFDVKEVEEMNVNEVADFDVAGGNDFEVDD